MNDSRTLIVTRPADLHAHAVAWALRTKGHECDIVFFGDLPIMSTATYRSWSDCTTLSTVNGPIELNTYGRYWIRKPDDPILPDGMHPADRPPARMFWTCLMDSVIQSLGLTDAFFVNPTAGSEVHRLKQYQLAIARKVGLEVPATLISNDSAAIRGFIDDNAGRGWRTIAKPLYAANWDMEDGGLATFDTTLVEVHDIVDPGIRAAPTIFQREIPKRSEVRLTIMGETLFAANLDTQSDPAARIDSRLTSDWGALGCERIDVPERVKAALIEFNKRCHLNFGTMDFIIDSRGEWIFLETNPLGQFLWNESINPELPLLDAFSDFIISCDDAFRYHPGARRTDLADFLAQPTADGAFLHGERQRHPRRGAPSPPDESFSRRRAST